jgi:N-methylhydantoinase A/oxoprolinase/acetone carboxylase beta subunit
MFHSKPSGDETHRLGIDVGGTNTDAVILTPANKIVARAKSPTTPDVMTGILNVLDRVLSDGKIPLNSIRFAMLGTTHCTNAITTRQGLSKIAVIRLGAPATIAVPPLLTWPSDLRDMCVVGRYILPGGHEYNGEEIARLDVDGIRRVARDLKGKVRAVAVVGVFSPVNQEHETRTAEILKEEFGDEVAITLSSEIGSVGLIERENAAALNAALVDVAETAIGGFERAIRNANLQATLLLGQNDGTLMSSEYALRYPIYTIASGPSNSIRGAAFLSGLRDAIIVDIGGTTSDIGILQQGFPRESSVAVEIGGVRTNFRMPDLISVGLGGGSRIHENESVRVGPDSVGYRLSEEALVFGGNQLTATDIAVAAGRAQIGDAHRVARLPRPLIERAMTNMAQQLEENVDRMKLTAEPVPVVVVGGGSILFPDHLAGASRVTRPPHFDVANAIGVAIAQVSGTVDRIFATESMTREQALDQAMKAARDKTIVAGADPKTIEILEVEEVPLAYMPGNAVRLKIKAAGELRGAASAMTQGPIPVSRSITCFPE